jgi:hypothetical protein
MLAFEIHSAASCVMSKKRDPELLAKISLMQRALQKLVKEFYDGEDDSDAAPAPARNPLDTDLIERVRRIVAEKPTFFLDIVAATDQPENKIKAVLTKMQRDGELVVNLGKANKALWYLLPPKTAAQLLDRLIKLGVRAVAETPTDQ